jgi:plastocyanin
MGSAITIAFDNQDAGVAHDLVVYAPGGAVVAQSAVITGPSQTTVTFTPGAAGNYPFKCSLHPQTMTGSLAVAP